MKVQQEGKVPFNWKTTVKCAGSGKEKGKGCEATLEVEEQDLVLRYWRGTHFTHYYAAVKCPCCGKYTYVNVPDSIWERVNTAKNKRKATFDGIDESI